MLNKIKLREIYKSLVNQKNLNYPTILVQSITVYFLWITLSAIFVFQQFSTLKIISVSIVFLCLYLLLIWAFYSSFFKNTFSLSIQNILLSFILFILLVIVTNFSYVGGSSYAHIFPLLDTELGLGWHYDTAYHTSNIQSILNSGYPSVGQRGYLFLFYPALSHYVDALILYITNLEPYDSYGMFRFFHQFILYSTISIFIVYTFKNFKPYVFLIVFAIVVPIIAEGHTVGSHSLWFTSVFLVMTAPKVFNLLIKEGHTRIKEFVLIFIIIVILSFGKISTGFMYATFIGFYLLIKQPKNILIYLFGFSLIVFFLGYSNLMHSYSNSGQYGIDLSRLIHIPHIGHYQKFYIASIASFAGLAFIFRNRTNFHFLFASIMSFIVIVAVTNINLAFNASDIWYFYFGMNSVFVLFLLQNISRNMLDYQTHFYTLSKTNQNIIQLLMLLSSIYISTFYVKAYVEKTWKPRTQIDAKFVKTNKYLKQSDKYSYRYKLEHPFNSHQPKEIERPLKQFREELYKYLKHHHMLKENTVIYLSKELFQKDLPQLKGASWARSMLIYSVTGIPLVYGIEKLRTNYGYADYDKRDLWKKTRDFRVKDACALISSQYIVQIVSFKEPTFLLHDCNDSKE